MHLVPFTHVDGTPFTITPTEVRQQRGSPAREGRNEVQLDELDYGHIVFRFQDGGRLEEVTLRAPVLHLGNVAVPFRSLAAWLREHDPHLFERAGFVVSPAYGLAFDPADDTWVTALAAHCLDEWRKL